MIAPHTTRIEFPGEHRLRLHALTLDPLLERVSLARLPTLPPLGPPPDVGVDPTSFLHGVAIAQGRVFWVTADGSTIAVVECDGTTRSVFGCGAPLGVGAAGMSGLAAAASELYVSLPDHGSVVAFELATAQVSRTWSGLDRPTDLSASPTGDVLVATAVGVVELGPGGAHTLLHAVEDARSLTWARLGDRNAVVVAAGDDRATITALAFDGGTIDADVPAALPFDGPAIVRWVADRLVIASPDEGTVWLWDTLTGTPLGSMTGDPIAPVGVALDGEHGWWFGDGQQVLPAGPEAIVSRGTVTVGPLPIPPEPELRQRELLRLKLRGELGPVTTRSDVTFARADGSALPSPTATVAEVDGGDRLLLIPAGAAVVTVHVELSDPTESIEHPIARHWIDAIELRYDERSLIEYLPAIYRAHGDPDAFLDPFLRLLSSGNHDLVDTLVELPDQFDPSTSTDDLDGARWLDWLATWVDARIDERWPADARRRVVAEAFERHGRRGTPEAIRHRIELELGVTATIVEPGDLANPWVLGEEGIELGMSAMLADAPAGGSAVDITAVVDRSHLIGPAEIGAPLFGDLAHRFHVLVHATELPEALMDELRAVIEREKPAHTHVHICRVEPGIHLGLGGHIGVDLVIGPITTSMDGLDGFGPNGRNHVDRPRLGDPTPEPLILR